MNIHNYNLAPEKYIPQIFKSMKAISTLTLRKRIGLLALLTLGIGLVIFSWLGIYSINESITTTLNERLIIAKTLAGQMDQTLTYITVQLQNIFTSDNGMPGEEEFNTAANQASLIFEQSGIQTADILMIDESGKVLNVASENPAYTGFDMSVYPDVKNTILTGEPVISGLLSGPFSETPVVLIITPITDAEDNVKGALACSIDIMKENISPFDDGIQVGQTGYMEIVDSNGMVIARTRPGFPPELFEKSDHPVRFATLITEGQASVGTCHRCHEAGGEINKQKDILAFAPLQTASWGIAIRQSEKEALSPANEMERNFLILGVILLVCTLLLVLAVMQGIVKPIRMLTFAAKKVASNEFDADIPLQRGDEIGELSTAFADMRQEIARARENMITDYKEAKYKEELRGQLLSSVITAQEEERKRIARELHDEYGQTLTGLLMNIESLEDMLTPEQSNIKNKITNAKSILVRTLEDMRKLTLNLRPSSLDDLGLIAAINAHLQMQLGGSDTNVNFKHYEVGKRLNPASETAIFRIIQEAVHNIMKHADARSINIELLSNDGKITLKVEDDGRGFDTDSLNTPEPRTQSWGIIGMKERAELLHGTFTISSAPGEGTKILIVIPVNEMQSDEKPDNEITEK